MSMILQKIVLTDQILSSIAPWHKYDQEKKNHKINSDWTERKHFFVKKSSISLLVEDIQIIFMLNGSLAIKELSELFCDLLNCTLNSRLN